MPCAALGALSVSNMKVSITMFGYFWYVGMTARAHRDYFRDTRCELEDHLVVCPHVDIFTSFGVGLNLVGWIFSSLSASLVVDI